MVYYFYNTITEKWEPVPDNNVEAELEDRADELHAECPDHRNPYPCKACADDEAYEIERSWILAHQASDIKTREDGDK